jgi:hypothetical protein
MRSTRSEIEKWANIYAQYMFVEEAGKSSFMLETQQVNGFSRTYRKHYVMGSLRGRDVEITPEEFNALKEEAEADYGYLDSQGDFVPRLPAAEPSTCHCAFKPIGLVLCGSGRR